MHCQNCGHEMADDAKTCEECGTPVWGGTRARASDDNDKKTKPRIDFKLYIDTERQKYDYDSLYIKTMPYLRRQIRLHFSNPSDVEDLLQEVFIRIFSKLPTLKDPDAYLGWAIRICQNKCGGEIEKQKRRKGIASVEYYAPVSDGEDEIDIETVASTYAEDAYIQMGADPESIYTAKERDELLHSFLDDLPFMQRECLVRWQEGKKRREIAEELEMAEGTVSSNINYALKKIKAKAAEMEKMGVPMFGFAPVPLFLWLFHSVSESDPMEVPANTASANPEMFRQIMEQCGLSPATGSATTGISGAAASNAGGGVTTTTAAVFHGKAVAVIAAAVIAGVSGVAGYQFYKTKNSVPVKETETVEETTESELETPSFDSEKATVAYEKVLDEYRQALSLNRDEFNADNDAAYQTFPDVNETMLYNYFRCYDYDEDEKYSFFYAYYDIDSNGVTELLIGYKFGGTLGTHPVIDMYGFDGETAVKLIDGHATGGRGYIEVYTDGTVYVSDSGGNGERTQSFYRIADNGYELSLIDEYTRKTNSSSGGTYYNSKENLTQDEFEAIQTQYTEVSGLEWIPLIVDADTADSQDTVTTYSVTLLNPENGTLSFKAGAGSSMKFGEGDKVVVEMNPYDGYVLEKISVMVVDTGKTVAKSGEPSSEFSFTMPAADIKVVAVFAASESTEIADSVVAVPEESVEEEVQNAYVSIKTVSSNTDITNNNLCYSLEGAVYGIYDDSACTTLCTHISNNMVTTNADGSTDQVAIPLGTHYVKEITASTGYRLDTEIYPVTLTQTGESVTITSTEEPKTT